MAGIRWRPVAALLVCISLSALWSYGIRGNIHGGIRMVDFGELYYGARCVIHHEDAYNPATVLKEFKADGGKFPTNASHRIGTPIVITVDVYPPTAVLFVVPFAMLPWAVAQPLWIFLMMALLVLAGYLAWDLGSDASVISGCMICFMLLNCEVLTFLGNIAGIAVSLCVIAVWCFLKERYAVAGVFLLAVSLVIKPHDAGFVWLFFLLAGGVMRKRALQTLAVVGVLSLLAVLWINPLSPHWIQELHNNLATVSAPGSTSDPTMAGITSRSAGMIISLQSVLSILWNNPHFFNITSYLLGGILILVWIIVTLRRRFSFERTLLALAAISTLTFLPIYHRPYDAKLLMLVVPACILLWTRKIPGRRLALVLTSAGILATSDIPLGLLTVCTKKLPAFPTTLRGKIIDVFLLRPVPLVILAMGIFYLWQYMHYNPTTDGSQHGTMRANSSSAALRS